MGVAEEVCGESRVGVLSCAGGLSEPQKQPIPITNKISHHNGRLGTLFLWVKKGFGENHAAIWNITKANRQGNAYEARKTTTRKRRLTKNGSRGMRGKFKKSAWGDVQKV